MRPTKHDRSEQGHALYLAMLVTLVLTGFATSMLEEVTRASGEAASDGVHMERLYVAEAGLQRAVADLDAGGVGAIGSAAAPVPFGDGSYWVEATDNGDDTWTLLAHGEVDGRERAVEAIVQRTGEIFHWAVFAGNESRDPLYTMEFGGTGSEADLVNGDLYSGGHIRFWGDAQTTGSTAAAGFVSGVPGQSGISQPVPDIANMAYGTNHDVNVNQEFATGGAQLLSDDAGGTAWQLPEDNPAHIFRKNPNDRLAEIGTTTGDDYFLEDPYEPVRYDSAQNGQDPYVISLSGNNRPGPNGNNKVYYIDGTLWVHNRPTLSFQFRSGDPNGTRVTFVVKGNIVFSDNIFYENPQMDGVAFIAVKDKARPNSGNIYFGDPRGGTLVYMDSFMYAQNDFHDVNLDASGSQSVTLNGVMSAGDHVAIQRDHQNGHSRLQVDFDTRIRDGDLRLPGLPGNQATYDYEIVSWREVSASQ